MPESVVVALIGAAATLLAAWIQNRKKQNKDGERRRGRLRLRR
jgi:hypothetical protein